MYMAIDSIKEHWHWNLTRLSIVLGAVGYAVFATVLVVTLLTKNTIRVALQDGSPQACFVRPQ